MLASIKFAFSKENKNIKKCRKKVINLKTLKFKTILFNKYINMTMLAIINFPKINEKCIKILKLSFLKELMTKTTLLRQSETM